MWLYLQAGPQFLKTRSSHSFHYGATCAVCCHLCLLQFTYCKYIAEYVLHCVMISCVAAVAYDTVLYCILHYIRCRVLLSCVLVEDQFFATPQEPFNILLYRRSSPCHPLGASCQLSGVPHGAAPQFFTVPSLRMQPSACSPIGTLFVDPQDPFTIRPSCFWNHR